MVDYSELFGHFDIARGIRATAFQYSVLHRIALFRGQIQKTFSKQRQI